MAQAQGPLVDKNLRRGACYWVTFDLTHLELWSWLVIHGRHCFQLYCIATDRAVPFSSINTVIKDVKNHAMAKLRAWLLQFDQNFGCAWPAQLNQGILIMGYYVTLIHTGKLGTTQSECENHGCCWAPGQVIGRLGMNNIIYSLAYCTV